MSSGVCFSLPFPYLGAYILQYSIVDGQLEGVVLMRSDDLHREGTVRSGVWWWAY